MERACHKALKLNIVRYRHIATMLKNGREQLPLPGEETPCPVVVHDNVRGADYYQ